MSRARKRSATAQGKAKPPVGYPAETGADAIVDNRGRRVGDFLRDRLDPGSDLSIISAYFTIYAYEALRAELENVGHTRFLYGEPHGVGTVDPEGEGGNRLVDLNSVHRSSWMRSKDTKSSHAIRPPRTPELGTGSLTTR